MPVARESTPSRDGPRGSRIPRAGGAIVRHGVRITSPGRLQYPDVGITKRDLADYYERIAERMLPQLRGRPLTLIRCPRGVGESCFVQQHHAKGIPRAVRRVRLRETSGRTTDHFFVDDLAGVLACVQIGALELHGWGSREGSLENPDRLVIDLDPDPELPFTEVIDAARLVHERLSKDGIASWPMLTGGKGIHVVATLEPTTWKAVSEYAKGLATSLEHAEPARFTAGSAKVDRPGRIYLDYVRNQRGITAIAPYSTRAKEGAPVALPIAWRALDGVRGAREFTVRRAMDEGVPDPPRELGQAQRLPRTRS
ncbi:MAG: non-homologous end-joining DNA ligase [Pseudomonadota bacterium]|jgi:DNA polymerase LigD, polymerase domain|nr:MAG: hypothetical protein DIU56_00870 [Pseudomonadota bacterium]